MQIRQNILLYFRINMLQERMWETVSFQFELQLALPGACNHAP